MLRFPFPLLLLCLACAAPGHRPDSAASERAIPAAPAPAVVPEASPWPEASARFHDNGAWLGADSAYSIALDDTHVLWLFADTFLDPTADGTRENGPNYFIRNSVGIQTGPDAERAHDLSQSSLRFHWGPVQDQVPTSFFHDVDGSERWTWPLHGARLPGGELLLFRMRVVKDSGGFGFRVESWDALAIDQPLASPSTWQPRIISEPQTRFGKLLGSSVLISGDHLYAYGVENQGQEHAIYLARWPLAKLAQLPAGALDDPEWWVDGAFVAHSALAQGATPGALFQDGQVELSVHYEPERQRFVELKMQGLFVNDARTQLAMRTAPRPEGPWSALRPFHRPAESGLPNVADLAAYAGKAHPEQRGADLVLTYVVNDLKRFPPKDSIYYPQVLRLSYHAAGADAGSE
jgi:hypothetical protein